VKPAKSMKELSEWSGLKRFIDRRLIRALGHPVREHILAVLNERVASGKEIGDEIGADVSSFYHHIEELQRLDCIEKVETRRRRGVDEHFFRAKRTLFFDDAEWQRLPASLKSDVMVNALQGMIDDAVAAIEAETFSARGEAHSSWLPGIFDARGWSEATSLMTEALDRLAQIRHESSARLVKDEADPISVTIGILAFETPPRGRAVAA
jgi:DNA-binding transcriptional ArsR family regulator